MIEENGEKYYSATELYELTGVGAETIRFFLRNNLIKHIHRKNTMKKDGRFARLEDVMEFIETNHYGNADVKRIQAQTKRRNSYGAYCESCYQVYRYGHDNGEMTAEQMPMMMDRQHYLDWANAMTVWENEGEVGEKPQQVCTVQPDGDIINEHDEVLFTYKIRLDVAKQISAAREDGLDSSFSVCGVRFFPTMKPIYASRRVELARKLYEKQKLSELEYVYMNDAKPFKYITLHTGLDVDEIRDLYDKALKYYGGW